MDLAGEYPSTNLHIPDQATAFVIDRDAAASNFWMQFSVFTDVAPERALVQSVNKIIRQITVEHRVLHARHEGMEYGLSIKECLMFVRWLVVSDIGCGQAGIL